MVSCLGSCLQWCLKIFIIFLLVEKFNSYTWVALVHSRIQRSVYVGCSIAQLCTVHGFPLCTVAHKPEHKIFGLGFACRCPSVDFVFLSGL